MTSLLAKAVNLLELLAVGANSIPEAVSGMWGCAQLILVILGAWIGVYSGWMRATGVK